MNAIVNGRRAVTPDTAWLLAEALNTTPNFWMNLQTTYDLALERPDRPIARIRPS